MIEKCGSIFDGKTNITSSKTRRNKSIKLRKNCLWQSFWDIFERKLHMWAEFENICRTIGVNLLKITIYLSYILSRITILFYVQNTDKANIVATPLSYFFTFGCYISVLNQCVNQNRERINWYFFLLNDILLTLDNEHKQIFLGIVLYN